MGPASPKPSTSGSPTAALTLKEAGPPIDFSFKDLKQISDVLFESPVSGVPKVQKLVRETTNINEYLDAIVGDTGSTPPHQDMRMNSNALRLCNNHLTTLKGLERAVYHLLDSPNDLTWLDVSCNQLPSLEDVILKFPKLQVLYLHGNHIASMHDIAMLSKLPLQKLTLHGNPVAEKKAYKLWVCAHLPHLRSLDFSTITKDDREKVATWYRGYMKHQESK